MTAERPMMATRAAADRTVGLAGPSRTTRGIRLLASARVGSRVVVVARASSTNSSSALRSAHLEPAP